MTDGRIVRGQATREQLLATARELFGEHGYEGTSIEAVLTATGVARGALYHHFASKARLFDAVVEAVFVEIAEQTNDAALASDEPLERIRMGGRAWLRMALDPAVQRIALLDPLTVLGWTRWRELDEQYTLGGLRASFNRLGEEARIPPAQAELFAHMLLAALNEAALFIARADDPAVAVLTGEQALDTLLDRLAGARA